MKRDAARDFVIIAFKPAMMPPWVSSLEKVGVAVSEISSFAELFSAPNLDHPHLAASRKYMAVPHTRGGRPSTFSSPFLPYPEKQVYGQIHFPRAARSAAAATTSEAKLLGIAGGGDDVRRRLLLAGNFSATPEGEWLSLAGESFRNTIGGNRRMLLMNTCELPSCTPSGFHGYFLGGFQVYDRLLSLRHRFHGCLTTYFLKYLILIFVYDEIKRLPRKYFIERILHNFLFLIIFNYNYIIINVIQYS